MEILDSIERRIRIALVIGAVALVSGLIDHLVGSREAEKLRALEARVAVLEGQR